MREVVQRKATKIIPSLKNLPCNEKLKGLGMFSLRCTRLRDDIEVFKIIHGIDKINVGKLFCIDVKKLREKGPSEKRSRNHPPRWPQRKSSEGWEMGAESGEGRDGMR